MAALTLAVTGMTCGHCQAKVAKALSGVEGVYAVDVDLALGMAHVDVADAKSGDRLVAAVQAAGYRATVTAGS